MVYLKNVRLDGEYVNIGIEDGKFAEILPLCAECSGIDFGGAKIYPGLIEIHSHGAMGVDTMDCDVEFLAREYLRCGVTTLYPTTMTASYEDSERVVRQPRPTVGANIPGYHLEGPFINAEKCGAQKPELIKEPDLTWISTLPNVALVTVAPECAGAMEFIEGCGAVVCLGHTAADYDTASAAIRRGAKCLTHTFNAMPPIHHRAPGPILAGADLGAYAQIISDGIHLHPSVVRAAVKLFGKDKVVLISDSVRATGLADGEYELGGQLTTVKDGVARIANGALAGSTTTLFECVRRAISFGISEADAVKMASENPARLMGLNKGKIAVGYDADFIIVDDSFNLVRAVARGEV